MGKLKELLGQSFGNWEVLRKDTQIYGDGAHWVCQCICGKVRSVKSGSLLSGRSKGCGCIKLGNRLPLGEQSFNEVYSRYKTNAKKKGRDFELSKEIFKVLAESNCYYCGIKPSKINRNRYGTGGYVYNGIDRKDNSQGYTVENSVPCCEDCNRAKLAMTAEAYVSLCRRVVKHND